MDLHPMPMWAGYPAKSEPARDLAVCEDNETQAVPAVSLALLHV